MHVLVVNNIYPPIMAGGAELIVAYLAEELAGRGHRVTVVSTCGPQMEPYPTEHRNGVEVIRFFPRNLYWLFDRAQQGRGTGLMSKVNSARWHLRDSWNRDAARRVAAIMAEAKPDVMNTHLLDGFSASIWRQAKRRGMPVVHTAHDYHLICPRAIMLTRSGKVCTSPTIACRAYRGWHMRTTCDVDLFTSPSQFLLDQHLRAGLASRAHALLRYGIPLPIVARPPRVGPRNRFLFLARLTEEKGVRVVLDAMAQLPANAGVELAIGGRGPLEPEVRAAAERDPRIRFLGFLTGEAKDQALAESDHLLMPSLWYENAPLVILEAAANGLCLIGSRFGAIPEFVREGRTGLLFEAGNAASLADAMLRAKADEAMLAALPAHGAALVRDHTVPTMADNYLRHFNELLETAA